MAEKIVPFKGQNQNQVQELDNRHIVDRLADVRDQIAYLKAEESELKEKISRLMGSRTSLGGDEYIATKVVSERMGTLDTRKMWEDGIDIEKYRKPKTTSTSIRLEERRLEA